MSKPSPADVENLAALFEQSDWTHMRLKTDGLEIVWSNDANAAMPGHTLPATASNIDALVQIPNGMAAVRAPHLGTFHRTPAPGAPPYVDVGQAVAADTEVCRVEVLGRFTSIAAGISGVVREICAADAHLVEFDQPLIIVDPVQSS